MLAHADQLSPSQLQVTCHSLTESANMHDACKSDVTPISGEAPYGSTVYLSEDYRESPDGYHKVLLTFGATQPLKKIFSDTIPTLQTAVPNW